MSEPSPGAEDAASSKPTVYVIDDEKAVASLIEAILLDQNYEVYVSYTAEEALSELKEASVAVDLFLIDVVLPEMSGPDLAQELLQHSPNAKILFTSGFGEGAGAALRQRNPEAMFLSKPFEANGLVDAVATALQ